mgnify:CR=1 FL=1
MICVLLDILEEYKTFCDVRKWVTSIKTFVYMCYRVDEESDRTSTHIMSHLILTLVNDLNNIFPDETSNGMLL